ncbi:calcitonin gene-related peptide 2 isoform X1 [Dasypus novemcinctus]|uniref:calcitonin gene-related peptide 2 isoform X1 n=1 Tax=Dasypus novemcinctus TaxID=9361 RepID=UPI0039C8D14C
MDFQKFSFLTLLVLCQVGSLQAAPFRSALESSADEAPLTEEEARLLLAALVKDLVQMKARELEQEQEAEGSSLDSPRSKRCGNLSTCVLGTHSQDLNNFHTFSGIDFGAETPGKKRDIASGLKRDHSPHSGLPQNAK